MKRLILSVLCGVLFSFPALAAEVKEVVSKQGIKAWLVEEHAVPLVAVKIFFKGSGYAHDITGKQGRASMASAMFTEGAGDMDSREFTEVIESRAIALQAGVDEDSFNVAMETLSEHTDKAFTYMGLALTEPRLDEDSLERTRRQALSILAQQEQRPGYLLWRNWQKQAFKTHPYSYAPVGVKEDINTFSHDDLAAYYQNYLTRENMIIAVVGDITAEQLSTLLDKHLAALPAKYNPDVTVKPVTIAQWDEPAVQSFAVPQTIVMFGLPGVERHDPDFFNAYVLNTIIAGAGSLTSRLGKEMRVKKGLTYGVGSYLDLATYSPLWRGSFATRNAQAGAALNVLRETLHDIAQNGVTQKELNDAKQYITGSFVLGLDSNADIANYLISMQRFDLGIDYLDKRNKLVDAVTLDGVNAVAKRLMHVKDLRIALIGEPDLSELKDLP